MSPATSTAATSKCEAYQSRTRRIEGTRETRQPKLRSAHRVVVFTSHGRGRGIYPPRRTRPISATTGGSGDARRVKSGRKAVSYKKPTAISASGEPSRPLVLDTADAATDMNQFSAPSQQYLGKFCTGQIKTYSFPASDTCSSTSLILPHMMYTYSSLQGYSWESLHRPPRGKRYEEPQPSDRRFDPWLVVRLDLVSLLKHPTPRVYVSENLPAMNELQDAETRIARSFRKRVAQDAYGWRRRGRASHAKPYSHAWFAAGRENAWSATRSSTANCSRAFLV